MEVRSGPESAPISRSELLLAAAIALAVLVILLRNDPAGLSVDPDSYMHLARFRDGHGIFRGGFFPRDNAPYGTVVPWTMPFDGALALFYAIGRAFTESSSALYFAAKVVSPFFCVSVAPLMFFGLRPFFSLRARVVIAGLAVTSPHLFPYSIPGQADHHAMIVWLSVLFVIALIRYLFLDWARHWQAVAAGIAAAVALWTSPEEFIVVGTGLSAVVLYRCMVERPRADRTWAKDLLLSGAFAVALTAAWLVDPPYEGLWAVDVDRLSIVYVSFAWLFAATLIGVDAYLSTVTAFSRPRNLVVATLLGGMAFLYWIAMAPEILGGPLGQVDRALFDWIDQTSEMQPLWRLSVLTAPAGLCLIAIWISVAVIVVKSAGLQRQLWIACAILMVPISVLGIRYLRSIYFAEVLGSIPLGLILAQRTRRYSKKFMEYSAVAASTCATLGVYSVTLLLWHELAPSREYRPAAIEVCGPQGLSETLKPIEDTDAIVMTELDFAPMVLYLSPRLRTVAAPYIRNARGILDVAAFFDAHDDGDARAILKKRAIKYVLICDTGQRERVDFFANRILHDTPPWLESVGSSSPPPAFRLYRVRAAEG